MSYALAEQWQSLVGTEVSGTVTDAATGDSRAYRLLCTRVSYSGFGEAIALMWDDKLAGGYRRMERTADDLSGLSAQDVADALEAAVRADIEAEPARCWSRRT